MTLIVSKKKKCILVALCVDHLEDGFGSGVCVMLIPTKTFSKLFEPNGQTKGNAMSAFLNFVEAVDKNMVDRVPYGIWQYRFSILHTVCTPAW